jgi:hypothetical protein
MIEHRIIKRQGQRKALAKVTWLTDYPSWIPISVLRHEHPFLVIDYALKFPAVRHSPDFCWIQEYIDNADKIQETHKQNGNHLWQEAIEKELKQLNDYKTFRRRRPGETLHDYTWIPYHCVFDVKFDGRRKCRLVAGGNHTSPAKESVFLGVVNISSVRLGFLITAMNDLQVCAADIGNAFLYGRTREKVFIKAGREFGEDICGETLIVDKSLYGLRTSSARFHEHLSAKLRSMGYMPSKADTDLWFKDMGSHYEYIARYVDDIIAFGKDPLSTINEVKRDYVLKGIGRPEYYLGGDVVELDATW